MLGDSDGVASLLAGVLSSDSEVRGSAEAALRSAESERPEELTAALLRFLSGDHAHVPLLKLSAVLLRSTVPPRLDLPVLQQILTGKAWEVSDHGLHSAIAQLVAFLSLRGPNMGEKLDQALLTLKDQVVQGNLAALVFGLKITKIVSLAAREYDSHEFQLPERLRFFVEEGLKASDPVFAPRLVRQAAVAVKSLAECSRFVSSSSIPSAWTFLLVDALGSTMTDSIHVRCTVLRALQALILVSEIGETLPREFHVKCLEILIETLRVTVDINLQAVQRDPPTDVDTEYDSDDGEPCGLSALAAACLELMVRLIPSLPSDFCPRVAESELFPLVLASCFPSTMLRRQFVEEPNEFIALHDDESAVNCPRQSATAVLENLFDSHPSLLVGLFQHRQLNLSDAVEAESLLWLFGNAWFLFLGLQEDGDPQAVQEAGQVLFNWVGSILSFSFSRTRLESQMLLARALWLLWACWRNEFVNDRVAEFIFSNIVSSSEAALSGDESSLVVGLYACKAFGKYMDSARGQFEARFLDQVFSQVLALLECTSVETVHFALETLSSIIRNAAQGLSSENIRRFVSQLCKLWESSDLKSDILLRDVVVSMMRSLLVVSPRPVAEMQACFVLVVENAPGLLVFILDAIRRFVADVRMMQALVHPVVDLLCSTPPERLLSHPDTLDCLRACLYFEMMTDSGASIPIAISILGQIVTRVYADKCEALSGVLYHFVEDVLRCSRFRQDKEALMQLGRDAHMALLLSLNEEEEDVLMEVCLASLLLDNVAQWLCLSREEVLQVAERLESVCSGSYQDEKRRFAGGCLARLVLDVSPFLNDNLAVLSTLKSLHASLLEDSEGEDDEATEQQGEEEIWGFGMGGEEESTTSQEETSLFASQENEEQCNAQAAGLIQRAVSSLARLV